MVDAEPVTEHGDLDTSEIGVQESDWSDADGEADDLLAVQLSDLIALETPFQIAIVPALQRTLQILRFDVVAEREERFGPAVGRRQCHQTGDRPGTVFPARKAIGQHRECDDGAPFFAGELVPNVVDGIGHLLVAPEVEVHPDHPGHEAEEDQGGDEDVEVDGLGIQHDAS